MAKFDLSGKTEQGWFDVEGGGRVEFRLLSADDLKTITAACIKKVDKYPKLDGQFRHFEAVETDWDLWNEMLWDLSIVTWEGLYDAQEREIPVTRENKLLLMTRVPAFAELHERAMKALKGTADEQAEASEKN